LFGTEINILVQNREHNFLPGFHITYVVLSSSPSGFVLVIILLCCKGFDLDRVS